MTTEDALWQDITEHPEDPAPKLILADRLDDAGQAHLAYALRWAARRGHYPHRSRQGRSIWWGRSTFGRHRQDPYYLPGVVFTFLPGRGKAGSLRKCKSIREAYTALGRSLGRLREALDLEPPKK